MGFTHIHNFVQATRGTSRSMVFDFSRWEEAPWIVIDWNNVCITLAMQSGGQLLLAEALAQQLFGALVESGARVCVVTDGLTDIKRSLIRMKRFRRDCASSICTEDLVTKQSKILESDLATLITFNVGKMVLTNFFEGRMSRDINDLNAPYIFFQATGEADPVIRQFCRKVQAASKTRQIFIFSNDHSLAVGLNNANTVNVVTVASLRVTNNRLKGSYTRISTFLEKLAESIGINNTRRCSLVADRTAIVWLSSLCDSEWSEINNNANHPDLLLKYFSLVLNIPFGVNNKVDKIVKLKIAARLFMAWKSTNTTMSLSEMLLHIQRSATNVVENKESARVFYATMRRPYSQELIETAQQLQSLNIDNIRIELQRRFDFCMDRTPVVANSRLIRPRLSDVEPSEEFTATLLSPLISLCNQTKVFGKYDVISNTNNILDILPSSTTVDDFNRYLNTINSALQLKANASVRDKLQNNPNIIRHKCKLIHSDEYPDVTRYTITELFTQHTQLPDCGVVNTPRVGVSIHWKTCVRGDVMESRDAYVRQHRLFERNTTPHSALAGNLFDLSKRSALFQKLSTFEDFESNSMTNLILIYFVLGLPLPYALSELQIDANEIPQALVDYANSENSDLRVNIRNVCDQFIVFWSNLFRNNETAKDHIFGTTLAQHRNIAMLVYAIIHTSTLLLIDSSTIVTRIIKDFVKSKESFVEMITHSLLLSPLFAMETANRLRNRVIDLSDTAYSIKKSSGNVLRDFQKEILKIDSNNNNSNNNNNNNNNNNAPPQRVVNAPQVAVEDNEDNNDDNNNNDNNNNNEVIIENENNNNEIDNNEIDVEIEPDAQDVSDGVPLMNNKLSDRLTCIIDQITKTLSTLCRGNLCEQFRWFHLYGIQMMHNMRIRPDSLTSDEVIKRITDYLNANDDISQSLNNASIAVRNVLNEVINDDNDLVNTMAGLQIA